eukprot:TRINITY_DN1748_c1_g1_i3.p1 TRINITY_DN1748_c1_g1~~TRINITY_DN1748_c1_g1_i3.p1  ORF type:complete len:102 (+),score=1.02 TRINITY_DN1748_c1_g1_i3:240-545(+)
MFHLSARFFNSAARFSILFCCCFDGLLLRNGGVSMSFGRFASVSNKISSRSCCSSSISSDLRILRPIFGSELFLIMSVGRLFRDEDLLELFMPLDSKRLKC